MFCHTFWSQSVMDQTISRLRAQDLPFAMAQASESRESCPLLSLWRLSKGRTLYSTLHAPIPSRSSPSPGGCIRYHWGTGPHHLTLHTAMAGTQLEHTFQARKATRQGCWHILWTPPPVWQVRSMEQCPNLKQEAGGKPLLRKSSPRKCWACGGRQLPGSCQNSSLAPLSECICSKPHQQPLAAQRMQENGRLCGKQG